MKSFIILFVFNSFYTTFSQTVTLRDTTNQYDYIIITVPEFVSVCEPFKQHKETVRDFKTLIVETTQIYSEFDSSSTPQDNIRDFISYAGTFWKEPTPKFILMAGSVQFIPNFNIVFQVGYNPYWQTDFYYTRNIYDDDSTTADFYVGRIPGKNPEQLNSYFTKVIEYENIISVESWMNNALFICEDDPRTKFGGSVLGIASNLPHFIRSYFICEIDTSVYYGNIDSVYYAINERGCSTVWFEGHSSDSSFANSGWIDLEDLNGFTNQTKYFISINISTQSAIIDSNTNLTNEMLFLNNAGSIGGIVFSGPAYWGIGKSFHGAWAQQLYDPPIQSLGQAFDQFSFSSSGLYWYMKTVSNLWADPSLKLKYDVTVDVENLHEEIPTGFALHQNYPNPFNPSTKIKFTIPTSPLNPSPYQGEGNRERFITLIVYNVLGKEIATLVNEERPAGNYEVEFNAANMPSGVYFYRIVVDNFSQTKKMILFR